MRLLRITIPIFAILWCLQGAGLFASSDLELRILTAAAHGDRATVRSLLAAGAPVDARDTSVQYRFDHQGETPLMKAALNGDIPTARLLLKAGAKIDARDHNGETALLTACYAGHLEMVRLLMKARASVRIGSRKGYTPLLVAADQGRLGIVEALLAAGADVNRGSKVGLTPLMAAAKRYPGMVALLIKRGARVRARSKGGTTALMMAVTADRPRIIRSLLKAGANIRARRKNGRGMLYYATRNNFMDSRIISVGALKILFQGGIRFKHPREIKAAQAVLKYGSPEIAAMCMRYGLNPRARDSFGLPLYFYANRKVRASLNKRGIRNRMQPLLRAVEKGETGTFFRLARRRRIPRDGMLRIIADRRINFHSLKSNAKRVRMVETILRGARRGEIRERKTHGRQLHSILSGSSRKALHAVLKKYGLRSRYVQALGLGLVCDTSYGPGFLKRVLGDRRRINRRDAAGKTMLMHATECNETGAVRRLLRAGAAPNLRDHYGRPALAFAIGPGTMDLLLRAGASIKNRDGRPDILCRMTRYGNWTPALFRRLKTAGANLHCRSPQGEGLPMIMVRAHRASIARELLAAGISDRPAQLLLSIKEEPRRAAALLRSGTPVNELILHAIFQHGRYELLTFVPRNYRDPSANLLSTLVYYRAGVSRRTPEVTRLIRLLLARGYFPSARNVFSGRHESILWTAIQGNDVESVRLLMNAGARVNDRNFWGGYPLTSTRNPAILKLLRAGRHLKGRAP